MEEYLIVGTVTSTHGIRGEVKVFPQTDDMLRFKKLKEVYLDTGKEKMLLHPESAKFFKQFVILKFKEFNNINEVEGFRGKTLYVDRKNAVSLKKDEYFIADLIGLTVVREDESKVGILKDVMQTGANDVYVIEKQDGSELLLPAIKDCIRNVDTKNRIMTVYVLPGLED
ncbi:MAG: 16S rRNA processing protein RimM [Lachnospiraceae bacterium]|nr:16S rRNA processing protein RimM [Lachnospiraceae bacterium]